MVSGFFVATPRKVYDKYGLAKGLQAHLPDDQKFLYCRNFEIKAAGFTYFHKELGYLHDSEITRVSAIDDQIEEEEEAKTASATPGPHTPGKLSTATKKQPLQLTYLTFTNYTGNWRWKCSSTGPT